MRIVGCELCWLLRLPPDVHTDPEEPATKLRDLPEESSQNRSKPEKKKRSVFDKV